MTATTKVALLNTSTAASSSSNENDFANDGGVVAEAKEDDYQQYQQEWLKWNRQAQERAKHCTRAELPDLQHLTLEDYQHVYEPSDDSYLFLDALLYEFEQGVFTTTAATYSVVLVLEVGCGTGVVSTYFQLQWNKHCKRRHIRQTSMTTTTTSHPFLYSIVTDVNPKAIQATLQTANQVNHKNNTVYEKDVNADDDDDEENTTNRGRIMMIMEYVQCDLASPFLPRLQNQVHVILINPPYVPTDDDEVKQSGIAAAWAGGNDGRRVVDRFVPQLAQLLCKQRAGAGGMAYLVTVDDNHPDQLASLLKRDYGLIMRPLLRRRARNEFLTIQKITWQQ